MTDLFDFGEQKNHLTCAKCGCTKPNYEFRIDNTKRSLTKRRSECRVCHRLALREIAVVKKTAPPAPNDCEFCGRTVPTLSLDHCHVTGKFRAWLCNKCNTGFAQLGDTAEWLARAAKFLRERENQIPNEN